MKKIILIRIVSMFLSFLMARKALAVWAPSTNLEEEARVAVELATPNRIEPELPRPRGIADRIEDLSPKSVADTLAVLPTGSTAIL